MTDQQYRDLARDQYQSDGEIEIDEGATVSRGSDPGAYVQAWVWVYNETADADEPVGSEDEEDQMPEEVYEDIIR